MELVREAVLAEAAAAWTTVCVHMCVSVSRLILHGPQHHNACFGLPEPLLNLKP